MMGSRRMDETHVDLTPLDPLADADRFDRVLRQLRRAAAPSLRSRRAALGVWGFLKRWRRPVYTAAGFLAASSLLVLTSVPPARTTSPTLAELVGVPGDLAPWTRSAQPPSPASLLQMELGQR
jgi:hypothetical protein